MNRKLYVLHRWIALAALAQLLVWTTSGLFFALAPIGRVRGEDRTVRAPPAPIPWESLGGVRPEALRGATELDVRMVDGRPWILARSAQPARRWAVDATGAEVRVDAEAAGRLARADQRESPAVLGVALLDERSAPVEYRGKPLPAWQVSLDDDRGTRIYVDALTGAVTARRNSLWRAYDFLWALHIMDYREREDFNHPLLVVAATFGVATALSGLVLWVLRAVRRARQRPSAQGAGRFTAGS